MCLCFLILSNTSCRLRHFPATSNHHQSNHIPNPWTIPIGGTHTDTNIKYHHSSLIHLSKCSQNAATKPRPVNRPSGTIVMKNNKNPILPQNPLDFFPVVMRVGSIILSGYAQSLLHYPILLVDFATSRLTNPSLLVFLCFPRLKQNS